MQHLEVSGAVRTLQSSLGAKKVKHYDELNTLSLHKITHSVYSLHTGWAKSRYTVINYILYIYFRPILYIYCFCYTFRCRIHPPSSGRSFVPFT